MVFPRVAGTVDRHVDLLSTKRRVGGSKFSSLSRYTRYLAKDCSAELQACFGVDVRSDVASVHPPFTCVVCQRLLAKHQGRMWLCMRCVEWRWWQCWAVAASHWSLQPLPFPQLWRKTTEEKKKKQTPPAAVSLPHALSAADHVQVTLRLQSPLSDCRRSRFGDRNSTRAGMPSLGVSRAVMMPKL